MLRKPRSHSQVNPASTDVEADSWARPLLCPKLRELSGNVHCWLLYEGLAIYFPFPTFNSFFFFFFKFLVVLVFTAGHRLSQLAESGDFSTAAAALATERQPGTHRFQQSWHTDLTAP